jgi:uncharacterized protein VirK/YbjX
MYKARKLLRTKKSRAYLANLLFEASILDRIDQLMVSEKKPIDLLANKLDMNVPTLRKYLTGKKKIKVRLLSDIFFALGRSLEISIMPRNKPRPDR